MLVAQATEASLQAKKVVRTVALVEVMMAVDEATAVEEPVPSIDTATPLEGKVQTAGLQVRIC